MAKILALACLAIALAVTLPLAAVAQQQGAAAVAGSTLPQPVVSPAASAAAAGSDEATDPSTVPLDTALLPRDLSPWGMFRNADIVVQIVMIGLAFASVLTWTIFLAKALQLIRLHRQMTAALSRLEAASSLAAAKVAVMQQAGPARLLLSVAQAEIDLSGDQVGDGMRERVASRVERVAAATTRGMARGTGFLATIGATAPFVGLFGTVWGIMNSFIGISTAHTTNLAVVAPGIAEALLATACGLVAAIPAVVVYNLLARGIMANKAILADIAAAIQRLVSRDADRDQVALSRAA